MSDKSLSLSELSAMDNAQDTLIYTGSTSLDSLSGKCVFDDSKECCVFDDSKECKSERLYNWQRILALKAQAFSGVIIEIGVVKAGIRGWVKQSVSQNARGVIASAQKGS